MIVWISAHGELVGGAVFIASAALLWATGALKPLLKKAGGPIGE